MTPVPDAPPAFTVPPDLRSPAGDLAVWFTDPPGAVVQLSERKRGTVEMASWLAGPGVHTLLDRFPGTARLVILLDLTLMKDRDPAVRPLLVEAAKALGPRIAQGIVVAPDKAGPVYLASVRAAASVLGVFGVDVHVARSVVGAIARAHLAPAAR